MPSAATKTESQGLADIWSYSKIHGDIWSTLKGLEIWSCQNNHECIWSMPNGPWYLEGWYLSNLLQDLNSDSCRLLKQEGLLLAIQLQELLDQ